MENTEKQPDKDDLNFIVDVIQRGRIRPAKYVHSLELPYGLYKELKDHGIIRPDNFYVNENAFFEFRHERVIISFINLCICDVMQFSIDRYLITDIMGKYPIVRTYQSKMNHDKKLPPAKGLMLDTDNKRKLVKSKKECFTH